MSIAQIYDEVKLRPRYLISETLNILNSQQDFIESSASLGLAGKSKLA